MIVRYEEKYEQAWDRFVLKESVNGTFLQTRAFLNYHPKERFTDASVMVMKGNNIIAAIPACDIDENGEKKFISHMGSTFGGIILGSDYKKVAELENIFEELDSFFKENNYSEVTLKMTSRIYSQNDTEILEYFLDNNKYIPSTEIGYYIDLEKIDRDNIESNFNSSRRRGYKKSSKYVTEFKELITDDEIKEFYDVLCNNMQKFDTVPVHTFDEILLLKKKLIPDNLKVYGVYNEGMLVAGSMVFCFDKVFHTQYLACHQDRLEMYPSELLYHGLIGQAIKDDFKYISFGTSTLEHGKVLNKSLAQFKEGFGTTEYVNRTYSKRITI